MLMFYSMVFKMSSGLQYRAYLQRSSHMVKLRHYFLLFVAFTHISSSPSLASESGNPETA